ncbi:MAG: hypothetical protein ACON4T_02100 [Synechococcus sp.]
MLANFIQIPNKQTQETSTSSQEAEKARANKLFVQQPIKLVDRTARFLSRGSFDSNASAYRETIKAIGNAEQNHTKYTVIVEFMGIPTIHSMVNVSQ